MPRPRSDERRLRCALAAWVSSRETSGDGPETYGSRAPSPRPLTGPKFLASPMPSSWASGGPSPRS
eukprot:5658623-Pyramimonas_sp.AAC.2